MPLIQELLVKLLLFCFFKLKSVNTSMYQVLIVHSIAVQVKKDRFSVIWDSVNQKALWFLGKHKDESWIKKRSRAGKVVLFLRKIWIRVSNWNWIHLWRLRMDVGYWLSSAYRPTQVEHTIIYSIESNSLWLFEPGSRVILACGLAISKAFDANKSSPWHLSSRLSTRNWLRAIFVSAMLIFIENTASLESYGLWNFRFMQRYYDSLKVGIHCLVRFRTERRLRLACVPCHKNIAQCTHWSTFVVWIHIL